MTRHRLLMIALTVAVAATASLSFAPAPTVAARHDKRQAAEFRAHAEDVLKTAFGDQSGLVRLALSGEEQQ